MKSQIVGVFAVAAALVAGQAVWAGEGCGAAKAGCESDKSKGEQAEIRTIDTEGLQQIVAGGAEARIIDARSAKYDDGKRIPGAIALTADASDESIAAALPDKEAQVITYCSNLKCPASEKLAKRLTALGYNNVVKYPDGIEGWSTAGQKVVEIAPATSPQG